MKSSLLVLILLFGIGCHAQTAPSIIQKAKGAVHAIKGDDCSSTAIAPHALLTAKHCLSGKETSITVDKKFVHILKMLADSNDHVILIVDTTFSTYARLYVHPKQADEVFIFGNPANLVDMFRKGVVAGRNLTTNDDKQEVEVTLYDMNIYFGDSGAAIFDSEGRIVGVVSYISEHTGEHKVFSLGASYDILFPSSLIQKIIDLKLGPK